MSATARRKSSRCMVSGHNWLTMKGIAWRTCVQPECRLLQWFDGQKWHDVTHLVNTHPPVTQQPVWEVQL